MFSKIRIPSIRESRMHPTHSSMNSTKRSKQEEKDMRNVQACAAKFKISLRWL